MELEELFCKLYPEYAVNGKPLSPYFDLFERGYEEAEENTELKAEKGCESCTKFAEVQLTNAKEIIKTLLFSKTDFDERRFVLWAWKEEVNKAEQFLKDSEVK